MKREGSNPKISRNIKVYQASAKRVVTKPEEIAYLYARLQVCEPSYPQFKQTRDAILRLAAIAADEQDMEYDYQEVSIYDSNSAVLKCALEDSRALIVYKQVCLLAMTKGEAEMLESGMILMKVYTDSIQLLQLFDPAALVYVCAEILKQQRSDKLKMIVSFVLYNVFRAAKLMGIGQDDNLFKAVIQHNLFTDLMKYCLDGQFEHQTLVNIIEALAALSDSECFLDYVDTLLAGDKAKLFVKFYDSFVVELLEDPEERGRMLCFDDVLSWIRRERPEAEDE